MFAWLSVIQGVLGFVSGPLARITDKIVELKIQQTNAVTEQAKVKAGEEVATMEAQRDVLIAESARSSLNVFLRTGFALPCVIYLWVLLFWWIFNVKIPPPPDDLHYMMPIVAGFYFVTVIGTRLIPGKK